jgi:phosphoglycolate phosphatase
VKHALIFDLDGTLVDSLRGIALALNHALSSLGLPNHGLSKIRGFIGHGARNLIQRAAPTGADEALLDQIEHAFKSNYEVNWPLGTTPYDGVVKLLESLQRAGHPLAVLSNKPHDFTTVIVEQVFPSIRFATVLGQRAGIPHKPDPKGALEIAETLGWAAADCVMIGDSTMDIETGLRAGMQTIAVTWGFHDRERLLTTGAGHVVDSVEELLGITEQSD